MNILLNDKFSTEKANQMKLEVWSKISRMVSALGVAQITPKERKDKWGNTKKEAKKVYSLARKEQRQTGGGPEIKLGTPAMLAFSVENLSFKSEKCFSTSS
jgi:hypothetical protein